jgi:hypothetical protein
MEKEAHRWRGDAQHWFAAVGRNCEGAQPGSLGSGDG